MIGAKVCICDNFNGVNKIRVELREVLNKSSNLTCEFLQNICKVKETHPFTRHFGQEEMSVAFLDRLRRHTEEGDRIIKREGTDAVVYKEEEHSHLGKESVLLDPKFHNDSRMWDALINDLLDAVK